MAAPYLIEIRIGGEVRHRLREIIYDVADEFGVQGAVNPRPVPHITLFGPYNTDEGRQVKRIVKETLSDYDLVPYQIDGFGRFEQNRVIYANIVPSPALRDLRRALSRRLRPVCYNYQPYDSNYFYNFHTTIAYKDVTDEFEDIWAYVNNTYNLQSDEYAIRVTSLRQRNMMWEYDLLQDRELRSDTATSSASWRRSIDHLNERRSATDHETLAPKPNRVSQLARKSMAKMLRRW